MGKDQEFLEAARNGHIAIIEKVLNAKAKRAGPLASLRRGPGVNVQDTGGYSALHHACLNGHEDIVRLLLANEALANLPDTRGSSPLHLAAWAGHEEIVRQLLSQPYRPANPNLQTIENETPLHCAAQHGHTGALALLLAHGGDPLLRNTRGETPLDLAAQYGRLQAVQLLIRSHPELIAPYTQAALNEAVRQSAAAASAATTTTTTHKQGNPRHSSPLPHSGSVSTPSPSSPSLVSSSASPTTPTCRRPVFPHTCLHLASRNGHKAVVDVLLAAGVSVNLLTPSGSALHEAALCGKETVVRTLLRAGIDLNSTDAEERTALDILKEFPPHVTKHIMAVINNFRHQMDTDDSEEVVYRHHPHAHPQGPQLRHSTSAAGQHSKHHQLQQQHNQHQQQQQQQQQQHYNHYHFNSNNHLLNHSLSMQQSAYAGKRYAVRGSYNGRGVGDAGGFGVGVGKSLDSGLQPEEVGSGGSELGVSPSSSLSSFEPASVSPRSRSSTGGLISGQVLHMSSFQPLANAAPPRKPPRRNLSVSPTHTSGSGGPHFTYTSPNHPAVGRHHHQQQQQQQQQKQLRAGSSQDSPYSHQSHGSVGGMSFDETQLRERQRGDRLYASARESTRSASGVSVSSSTDMLDQDGEDHNDEEDDEEEVLLRHPQGDGASAQSMKRRNISKDIINCENPTLKSYNPNRKLKRNRNSCSLPMGSDKERCSQSSDSNSDPKQLPMSPTNYQQPPTPDHPPPSHQQAEHAIYERIRPLSREYKRRSALLQLQQAQQHIKLDVCTSPPPAPPPTHAPPPLPQRHTSVAAGGGGGNGGLMVIAPPYDFAYDQVVAPPLLYQSALAGARGSFSAAAHMQGSSGSLSSSVSCSDQSVSTDCVEEFIGDAPFAGLLKGAAVVAHTQTPKPQPQQQQQLLQPHTNGRDYPPRSSSAPVAAAIESEPAIEVAPPQKYMLIQPQQQRATSRPPIATKPKLVKALPPLVPSQNGQPTQQPQAKTPTSSANTPTNGCEPELMLPGGLPQQGRTNNNNHHNNNNNNNDLDKQSLARELQVPEVSSTTTPTTPIEATLSECTSNGAGTPMEGPAEHNNNSIHHEVVAQLRGDGEDLEKASILSPFNAEEARKKISEIIESFGSGILNTNITPTQDIELDFDDLEVAPERHELALRLRNASLLHLERMLFENGYDNYKFVNGIFEESDIELMHIPPADAPKLLRFTFKLPPAEFQPQISTRKEQENKPTARESGGAEGRGVATLSEWLHSIQLPEYIESFNKHLYNTIDSVCGVWDVELQTVLEINKLGHRRRILQSLKQMREPKTSVKTPLAENNETNKMNGARESVAPGGGGGIQQRNSISGYRKNRPAPQPPTMRPKEAEILLPTNKKDPETGARSDLAETETKPLQIRAPSELLLGLPANLRTKWRHSANVLLHEQIKYDVQYLGSTVVKELRGTESTRKSIKKLRRDQQRTEQLMSSIDRLERCELARYAPRQTRPPAVFLAISHLGVEFIDVASRRTICEHEIQNINCACQDSEDLRHFAYITKEHDIHYCHVFSVESTDMATEIILTLGQAFEVAYQLALRDGITATPLVLNNSILQGGEMVSIGAATNETN